MRPSIGIDPREACECPKPLPWLTYYGIKNCKRCNLLIPRSKAERKALQEKAYEIGAKEGLWASKGKVSVDRPLCTEIVTKALRSDPSLSAKQLRRIVSEHGPVTFGSTTWLRIVRRTRAELGIEAPSKGGRPRKQCIALGCFRPNDGPHGYCNRCLGKEAA